MAKIKVENVSGFATTRDGKESNIRIRYQSLHGLEKYSMYPNSWDYIKALLADGPEAEGAVTNTIKFAPSIIDTMASIAEQGQLHPIYINKDKQLVDGFGRIEAVAFAQAVKNLGVEKLQICLEAAKTEHEEETDEDWADSVHTWATGVAATLDAVVTDKDPHHMSMEANIRRKDVSPLDLGYYFQHELDNGSTIPQVAQAMWPSLPLHMAMEEVENHIALLQCDNKTKSMLLNGTIKVKPALNRVQKAKDQAEGKEKVRVAAYRVGAKGLHYALTEAEKEEPNWEPLARYFGEKRVEDLGADLVAALRCICYIPAPKPKAEPKPKKKTNAVLSNENELLREKLAELAGSEVSIDELLAEEPTATEEAVAT